MRLGAGTLSCFKSRAGKNDVFATFHCGIYYSSLFVSAFSKGQPS